MCKPPNRCVSAAGAGETGPQGVGSGRAAQTETQQACARGAHAFPRAAGGPGSKGPGPWLQWPLARAAGLCLPSAGDSSGDCSPGRAGAVTKPSAGLRVKRRHRGSHTSLPRPQSKQRRREVMINRSGLWFREMCCCVRGSCAAIPPDTSSWVSQGAPASHSGSLVPRVQEGAPDGRGASPGKGSPRSLFLEFHLAGRRVPESPGHHQGFVQARCGLSSAWRLRSTGPELHATDRAQALGAAAVCSARRQLQGKKEQRHPHRMSLRGGKRRITPFSRSPS